MDYYEEKSQSYMQHRTWFQRFIDEFDDGLYARKAGLMYKNAENRLIINLNDMRLYDEKVASAFLNAPIAYIAPFQAALKEYVRTLNTTDVEVPRKEYDYDPVYAIGVEGSFGANRVTPRQLNATHVGQLVCVEGIVTKCSIVRPKVLRTVHYNEKKVTSYPTKDLEGNPLTTEFGLSKYTDHQTLSVQEMPEKAPAGLLPASVDVVLDDDLVDRCKPGDRIQMIGIYRAIPSKAQGGTSGVFRTVLIANHVKHLGKNIGSQSNINETDIQNIRKIAKRSDLFELMARSLAPSIQGHEKIKQALVLQLLGGVERNLDNGTHIRGDINMLLVGDPSTAKSQLLRFVLNIAPLAINTTGRGSSGVGLTAAVATDKETGERRLEAGAMVLADRGVVCIDEFDKMSDADRVAIHEVMEQQTVTIAKAGIHMSLNARCSVVAAANPRYSQYDSTKSPAYNVNLPDSLLSRFDFLFIILDSPNPELDRQIATKVLSNHRYNAKVMDEHGEEEVKDSEDTAIFQKFDKLLHASFVNNTAAGRRAHNTEILSIPFIKKYLEFAKSSYQPTLDEDAAAFVAEAYAKLRNREDRKESAFPVTARTLETLIRLSSAHAKIRLSEVVTKHDCEVALSIMKYAINDADAAVPEKKERDDANGQQGNGAAGAGSDSDDDNDNDNDNDNFQNRSTRSRPAAVAPVQNDEESKEEEPTTATRTPAKRRAAAAVSPVRSSPAKASRASAAASPRSTAASASVESDAMDTEDNVTYSPVTSPTTSSAAATSSAATATSTAAFNPARLTEVTNVLSRHCKQFRTEEIRFRPFMALINKDKSGDDVYSEAEATMLLKRLEDTNKIMFRGDVIHRI